ncbi:MAG TPA: hypothetical protein VNA24_02205 [Hyalangium sp.]|nr:hypothetical protein [Hyalangium sp.]
MIAWLSAFAFTQAVEVPIYLRAGASWRVAFLASALTHPFVWFGFSTVGKLGLGYWGTVVLVECFAIGVETVWLSARGVKRAFYWCLLANLTSVTLGFVSRWAFGWP